jgi:hypothetical protein
MNGLDDFKRVLREFRNLSVIMAGAAVTTPFLASFIGIIPPWPTGLGAITSVVELVALIVVYQTFDGDEGRVTRNIKWLAFIGFVLLIFYIIAFSMFTIYVPPAHRSIVIGFECLADAQTVFKDRCPFLSIDDLAGAVFDEFALWTKFSVTVVRTGLLVGWIALFIILALLIGQFLIFQMRRKIPSGRRRAVAPSKPA